MQIQVKGSQLECEIVSSHYIEQEGNSEVRSIRVGKIHYDKNANPPTCKVDIEMVYKTHYFDED